MRHLIVWWENGYCSIAVANNQLITVISFVSKSYIHPWKDFANRLHLILYAYEILFSKNVHEKFTVETKHRLTCSFESLALRRCVRATKRPGKHDPDPCTQLSQSRRPSLRSIQLQVRWTCQVAVARAPNVTLAHLFLSGNDSVRSMISAGIARHQKRGEQMHETTARGVHGTVRLQSVAIQQFCVQTRSL